MEEFGNECLKNGVGAGVGVGAGAGQIKTELK